MQARQLAALLAAFSVAAAGVIVVWTAAPRSPRPAIPSSPTLSDADIAALTVNDRGLGFCECCRLETLGADSATKQGERAQVAALAPAALATNWVVRSGPWSDAGTWQHRVLPAAGARVVVPEGCSLEVDGDLSGVALHWLRVDGELRFRPDADTALELVTLFVNGRGRLEIGSAERPVLAGCRARVVFADRGPRDRERDPADLTGGLVSLGRVEVHGARHDSFAVPSTPLRAGTTVLDFDAPPAGWQVGDRLLVPPASLECASDELPQVAALARGGRRVVLDRRLVHDHVAPAGNGAAVPVGNLTRNVTFASADPGEISRRGHVMFMHRQTGVTLDSAAFLDLGRTDAMRTHTVPRLDDSGALIAGTDDNTIGRYAVHFHVRTGACCTVPPHVVRNCAVVGSPKHGIVNHGGHVLAEDNVTWQVAGSGFFAENGTEIGAFRHNLAVRSSGSGQFYAARASSSDFGHGGHGFWLQGGGVDVCDNFAFGHAGSAYFYNTVYVLENGAAPRFGKANLRLRNLPGTADVLPNDLPILFTGNVGAVAGNGLEVWNNKEFAAHLEPSIVRHSTFWGLRDNGIELQYCRDFELNDITLHGSGFAHGVGIAVENEKTANLSIRDVRIDGFEVGIDMPYQGRNSVTGASLRCRTGIRIYNAVAPGRVSSFEDVTFHPLPRSCRLAQTDFFLAPLRVGLRGDTSMLFENDVITVSGTPGVAPIQLYFAEQAVDARPFDGLGIAELTGKTTASVWRERRLAIGGVPAPATAARWPRVFGLVGPAVGRDPALPPACFGMEHRDSYHHSFRKLAASDATPEGWLLRTVAWQGRPRTTLVYCDHTPPRLVLDPRISLAIHPDDVKFGFRLRGYIVDRIAGADVVAIVNRDYRDLHVDADGVVRLQYPVEDGAGHQTVASYDVRVDPHADRHGDDLSWFEAQPFPAGFAYASP